MSKKEKIQISKHPTAIQKVQLAMGFIGEHKEEFVAWLRSKGMDVQEEDVDA